MPTTHPLNRRVLAALLLFALTLYPADAAKAQKGPELGYVFPPAVEAGASTQVKLGGYDLTPDMQFFLHSDQARLQVDGALGRFHVPPPPYWFGEKARQTAFPIPREFPATVSVDSDCPPGLLRWQVANANGASETGVLFVSDIPEVLEQRRREEPQRIEQMPIGVSGRISKIAEIDRYTVSTPREGPLTVQLFARTLGADWHGVLRVRDDSGSVIVDHADTEGRDATLTFHAKADREYTVELHDVDFRGNQAFVYRLAFRPGPHVIAAIPAAGQKGQKQRVTFIGPGLASGQPKLETITREVTFPADSRPVLDYRLETDFGGAGSIRFPLSDHAELTGPVDQTKPLAAPLGWTARMPAAAAVRFPLKVSQGTRYQLAAQSRALGGQLDLSLTVEDATGKVLASHDDLPTSPDSQLEFTAKTEQPVTCVVRDLSGRGGRLDSTFRFSFTTAEEGFQVSAPQRINLPLGGKANWKVSVQRLGGFAGALKLKLDGLPAGVTAPDEISIPAKKNQTTIALQCAPDALVVAAPIRLTAQVEEEGKPPGETVVVRFPADGNLAARSDETNMTEQAVLAITMKPAFTVQLIDKNRQRAVHRGSTYPAPFIVKREEGFDGPIRLIMASKQGRHRQGITAPITEVRGERVFFPCHMPEWLETDRTTRMVVLGVGEQLDPHGHVRHITQPGDARITMILEGALLRVAHEAKEPTVALGESLKIPIRIARSAKLQETVSIQLQPPSEIADLVALQTSPLTLTPGEDQAELVITARSDRRLLGQWPLTIVANCLEDGQWLVKSQTLVDVQFVSPETTTSSE